MFNSFNISSIYVLDQDDALDFYVGKLGLEIGADIDMGFIRWLTVQVPGHPERQVLLEKPNSPPLDEDSVEKVRELVSKGAMGFTLGLTVYLLLSLTQLAALPFGGLIAAVERRVAVGGSARREPRLIGSGGD